MHIYLNILNMLKNRVCILYPPQSAVCLTKFAIWEQFGNGGSIFCADEALMSYLHTKIYLFTVTGKPIALLSVDRSYTMCRMLLENLGPIIKMTDFARMEQG
jgi:hypothetical protein